MDIKVKDLFNLEISEPKIPEVLEDSVDHTELTTDDFVVAKYIGRSSCGFQHNKKYLVKLIPRNSDDSRTTVVCIQDYLGNDVDLKMHFSSATSANMFFKVGVRK